MCRSCPSLVALQFYELDKAVHLTGKMTLSANPMQFTGHICPLQTHEGTYQGENRRNNRCSGSLGISRVNPQHNFQPICKYSLVQISMHDKVSSVLFRNKRREEMFKAPWSLISLSMPNKWCSLCHITEKELPKTRPVINCRHPECGQLAVDPVVFWRDPTLNS